MDVVFRLLGAMEAERDGMRLPLPGAAERSLLALLLLAAGRTVATSTLVDQLWSEDALPADPVNAVQLRVSKLRRALHPLDVLRDAAGYRLDLAPDAVDVHQLAAHLRRARAASEPTTALEEYDAALALWRGEPLADFAGRSWATVEVARLLQLRLAVRTERAEVALALGRTEAVVADLGPAVADDPRQEALAALLMTALYRCGRQAEALEVYARTRRALADELGLEPSAGLRRVHQQVLQQDPDLAVTGRSDDPAGAVRVALPVVDLVGRDDEVAQVGALLDRHRVVTLVGPGGAGKTSLALAVAASRGPAVLARLAPVVAAGDVPLAVAEALGVPLDGADPNAAVRDRVTAYLRRRRLLLVLDNCEHVVDAAARLVDAIATTCPDVVVLATSREALAVPGEVQVGVAPLAFPPPGTPADEVAGWPAAALLVRRAAASRADLVLDAEGWEAVRRICEQLDGMPLALELAAARMATLSLPELADRLGDQLALLTTGARTAEARQRTLRGAVEWSHRLLDEQEQRAFRRLAVFHGGWSLPAAEQVLADELLPSDDVLDVLDRLVVRSVVVAEPGHPRRFRMLEPLRQYAVERLSASGETAAVTGRHAAWCRALATEMEWRLRGHGQREALRRLRDENANLRAALSWLEATPGGLDDALQLGASLALYWHLGRHVEGREVLRRLVARDGGSRLARARALQAVSVVERPRACLVHPSPRCAETARESLALLEELGEVRDAALSRVLLAVEHLGEGEDVHLETLLGAAERQFRSEDDAWGLAVVDFVRLQHHLRRGDRPEARATGRRAAEAFRALDDPWGLSAVLYHLGWGLKEFGEHAEAVPVLEQAIEVAVSAGLHNTAQWALADLGHALVALDRCDEARARFDQAATSSRDVGDAAGQVLATHGLAVLALLDGQPEQALDAFERAAAGFTALGTPLRVGEAQAGAARCALALGRVEDAQSRYDDIRGLALELQEPGLEASALEGLAALASLRGDDDAPLLTRARHLREAHSRPPARHEDLARGGGQHEAPVG